MPRDQRMILHTDAATKAAIAARAAEVGMSTSAWLERVAQRALDVKGLTVTVTTTERITL